MCLRVLSSILTVMVCVTFCTRSQAAVVVSLDNPIVSGNTATVDVTFLFSGGPGDTLEAFQLSVIGSDPLLTAGGTDYSRFGFTPNASVLSDWSGMPDLATDGSTFYLPDDIVNGPFLSPSATSTLLGTLTVDLSGLAGAAVNVTLAGNDPLFATQALGTVSGNFEEILATFSQPNGIDLEATAAAVPEPSSIILFGVTLAALAGYGRRKKAIVK